MHAHTSFKFTADHDTQAAAMQKLFEVIQDEEPTIHGDYFEIEETYDLVWFDDYVEIMSEFVRDEDCGDFEMEGCVDTSESAGEYMDFRIEYKDGNLTAAWSDWYLIIDAASSDYEEFCEHLDFSPGSDEAKHLWEVNQKEDIYIISSFDDKNGTVLLSIPLCEPVDVSELPEHITEEPLDD